MRQPTTTAAEQGFTLLETIITITLIAILTALSMPTFAALISNTRQRSTQNTLVSAVNHARITALAQQSQITLCPSANQTNCDDTTWWHHGWIEFDDRNHNGKRDPDEQILNIAPPQPHIAIATTAGREHLTYRPDGSATGTNLTFTLCDPRGPRYASTVIVNNAGRPRSAKATPAEAATACPAAQ